MSVTRPPPPADYSKDNGHGRPTHLYSPSRDTWVATPAKYRTRPDGLRSHMFLTIQGRGEWHRVPSMKELETWCYDGIAETPSGDWVEPDHPSSWLIILGLI